MIKDGVLDAGKFGPKVDEIVRFACNSSGESASLIQLLVLARSMVCTCGITCARRWSPRASAHSWRRAIASSSLSRCTRTLGTRLLTGTLWYRAKEVTAPNLKVRLLPLRCFAPLHTANRHGGCGCGSSAPDDAAAHDRQPQRLAHGQRCRHSWCALLALLITLIGAEKQTVIAIGCCNAGYAYNIISGELVLASRHDFMQI